MEQYGAQPVFRDRVDAGHQLAERLSGYRDSPSIVLAVPRGGVPVAVQVAERLSTEMDVVVVRKIPVPSNPEAGYGAVTEDGTVVLNEPMVAQLGLSRDEIRRQAVAVQAEIARRADLYRGKQAVPAIDGRTAIIIDDGLASGFTMLAAVRSVRRHRPARVIVAVPVASVTAFQLVQPTVDDLVTLVVAQSYWFAVASFYQHWHDMDDAEVIRYLMAWRASQRQRPET